MFETVQEREVTFLAASISYYTLVSLIPLLTLGVVVAAYVGGDELQTVVQELAGEYLLPSGSQVVTQALGDPTGQSALSVVSLGITTWGALKLFRGLDIAFSRIYGSSAGSIADQLRDGSIALVAIGLGTLGVAAATAVIAALDVPVLDLLSPLLLLGLLCVAFFPLYYVFPDVGLTPRQALPGTVFAAVGWSALGVGFGLYASVAGSSVAGALGAILLLMTWFYFSGILVLFGAVINAVLAGKVTTDGKPSDRTGIDRQVQHDSVRRGDRTMSVDDDVRADATEGDSGADVSPRGAPDIEQLEREIEELRADLDGFEDDVDARTVEKPELESELKRYVRSRMRRSKARGWGPYLVLLYGTVTTIAAFAFLQDDLLSVVAMLIIYLSTLGLYVLFVIFGVGLNAVGFPGRLVDWVRDKRA
ncbi:YihY family inner membrane protein [Halopelagius longus]|uniref:YihY family inner membrane protein n=1 Tax=Halopelagius longus TaxID=1236180 RepID=A0A1H1E6X0_9EURY|nr:YihY family inner membrane protein [Halopelagius longus]